MSLMVDNQLPVALARYLGAHGWECIHVRDVGLDEASDQDIWEYAKARSLTIITKGPLRCWQIGSAATAI